MTANDRIFLVTGPARSGKSEWAEALATQSGQSVTYIATSSVDPADLDWQKRVELHRDRRPAHWHLREVPVALPEAILAATAQDCLLIDSLGTWLANLLEQDDATWQATVNALIESLRQTPATVVLVSEETGWGVVPAYPIGRLFRDRLGHLTRWVGTTAGAVYLVVAGYAVDVKQLGRGVGG
ncbi:bifunctional adenosylcobinamide kinase/adenosylcobinamide-phosphate guanylyltransferase [Nodosilinea sp. LEGE 06152]|uniref:bifunctional adenosylcobinamide kinase/adenosylcobinamide-phosphate guanylyltransferase n=1 Tax=Nodosilinea sp. LEGE 06152 TaxID=2777966 RepID=UPI00187E74A7|nr:bifunctional adenosylcobinamide kinase/adenosylcobinamide-phosphate guanylyltransferase [Nodosilinea sp. LEGE 06152]MBE9156059.1 bifunctional adenosylcobinamide kinase/adenosylcobinamide-phosphate guanylyltransferase [Nodosilinea sp. LEGE 06152]